MTEKPQMTKLYASDESRTSNVAAFTRGDVPVAVYGLGKMGLPLAARFADVTGNTVGVDVDPAVVDGINQGECHVVNEPGLPELVESTVERDALRATTDATQAAAQAAVHVIVVPTLLDDENRVDLSLVRDVTESIAAGLDEGDLVVLESTVPPGTCREFLLPQLREQSGLESGFGLSFCPERTASGRALRDIRESYPKVVGGVDDESTDAAALVYDQVTSNEVLPVSDATTAEAVKVFEGLYRDVNIALANQIALLGEDVGVDVWEAIETANTQPLCDILSPGPGVGGHCIPVYPYFLINEFDTEMPLLTAARRVNDRMPSFTVDQTRAALDHRGVDLADATVGVFGLTYKANIDETRNAPSVPIVEGFADAGATVVAVDPVVTETEQFDAASLVSLETIATEPLDAAVLVTAHDEFQSFDWDRLPASCLVVDCKNAVPIERTERPVYRLGTGFV